MEARPEIVVVGGVTAAGKTRAAVALARRLGGELIGADSVQIVRGFDIGSAKPTAEELGEVAHHLLDVVNPNEPLDAMRYAGLADHAIADVKERGRLPIVVGGTGLWIRALLRGLVSLPPPDPTLRADLEAECARVGAPVLHARLAELDPISNAKLHPHDARRIVRALEVHAQTGRALGELQDEHARGAPRYRAAFYVLDRPREELYRTLKTRLNAMLEAGWLDEVQRLLERWGPDVRAMRSVGYRQMAEHLTDGVPLDEAMRRAYKATRIYTRRQRTWFRAERGELTWTTAEALVADAHPLYV